VKVLVTGSAGFIGAAVAERLLNDGHEVIGLDNLNDYYDVNLKLARLERCRRFSNFAEAKLDLQDRAGVAHLFEQYRPRQAVNLAAQAGVRYSLENPHAYVDSNIVGFLNVLENCRQHQVAHLVYASSSSVYGANSKIPFSVSDRADHPVSLYGATKRANELMAYSYSHLYQLPATGLRFFTVYGPWGRPDMAPMQFARKILTGAAIDVYNHGNHRRDFTYIDDIVEGVVRVLDRSPTDNVPHRLYNIGNSEPVGLMRFIELLEKNLERKARKNFLPLQKGDVIETYADVDDLVRETGYAPRTPIEEGIARFVEWYKGYYRG
jgi:UDP-glucuronate 4-epimerase